MKTGQKGTAALLCTLVLFSGCSNEQKPFTVIEISMSDFESMMEQGKTFPLLIEREGCTFCAAMNEYIESTKNEHPNLTIYKIDATDFDLYRENPDDKTLLSSTEDGKTLLKIFPFYLYTPVIYSIEEGRPVSGGFGYDEANHTVSVWNLNSTIDWTLARPVYVWDYFQQAASGEASLNSQAQSAFNESTNDQSQKKNEASKEESQAASDFSQDVSKDLSALEKDE